MSKSVKNNKSNKKHLTIEPINKLKAALLLKISTMKKNGRKEIKTKEELEEYPKGSLISYMNTSGIYRSAGYIDKFEDESFIYLSSDFKTRYRVRYMYVKKMWVGDVYKTEKDLVSIIPSTNKKTKFFAKVGDVVVYYATDSTMIGRFQNTQKYLRMMKWYERYGDAE